MSNSIDDDQKRLEDFYGKGAFRDRHGRVWVPEKGATTTIDCVNDKITVTRNEGKPWRPL